MRILSLIANRVPLPAVATFGALAIALTIFGIRLFIGDEDSRILPQDPPRESSGRYDLTLDLVFPTKTVPTEVFRGNFWASPQLAPLPDGSSVLLVFPSIGEVAALEPGSGARLWKLRLPRDWRQDAQLLAAPVRIGDQLVVAYTLIHQDTGAWSHQLAVIDLARATINPNLPVLEMAAEVPASDGKGVVRFSPDTLQPRSALTHIPSEGGFGRVYVSFGSIRDQGA